MTADFALRLMVDLFWTGLLVSLPVMGTTLLVGVVIGVLQVVTQVQEMALSFVPKLVLAALSMVIFGPWMLRQITGFSSRLWLQIPHLF